MKNSDVRNILMDRTISVIAQDGLDKTTTKAIVEGTGINEVYIYRQFANKEDLLQKTFDKLDEEVVSKAMLHIPVMYMLSLEYRTRCRFFFNEMWKFLLGNKEKCLAYVQYYYSPYFRKHSAEGHRQRFLPLVQKFQEAFKEEANAWMLLNYMLNTMLDFAVKVYSGELPDDGDTEEHVFRVVYYAVSPYFKRANGDF